MKNKRINAYLIGAVLTLAVIPLLASYWILDEVLRSAIGLVVKPESQQLLEQYRDDLKALKRLEPHKEHEYKRRFLQVGDELLIYQKPQLLQQVLHDTYITYYLTLFIVVLIFSIIAAVWLSRKVARSYKTLLASDINKAKKIQELSNFDEWQVIASKLAHEINNPLTPIEMMVSNLSRVYHNTSADTFKENLNDTQMMVSEEVQKLKGMVNHFSKFAKLPEPVFKTTDMIEYCTIFIRQHQNAWPQAKLTLVTHNNVKNTLISLDNLLFNQCLINIINNAVQANLKQPQLNISLTIKLENETDISLIVFNDGIPIETEKFKIIFKMYYSDSGEENMGLGLAIVKKIVLDHGGDITCLPLVSGTAFKILLPLREHEQ
ncbi:MAG: nitrogen fixation/metabolism regulation signal transduction histidine kinase [Colwellia sp.]|jgi:nitrogen fixation/metabolism regulation signal transduction histidine kinase